MVHLQYLENVMQAATSLPPCFLQFCMTALDDLMTTQRVEAHERKKWEVCNDCCVKACGEKLSFTVSKNTPLYKYDYRNKKCEHTLNSHNHEPSSNCYSGVGINYSDAFTRGNQCQTFPNGSTQF